MARQLILVHGGVGEPEDFTDGCIRAAEAGMEQLLAGGQSLDAVLAAVVVLEDDPRFNAGHGALPGLDGRTIEMDASIMDSRGRQGSVAGIQSVKNPCLVARKVANTPHSMLGGSGATQFAHAIGFAPVTSAPTALGMQKYRDVIKDLTSGAADDFQVKDFLNYDIERLWNYEGRWQDVVNRYGHGTVGAVALDAEGHFAVCTSSGGSPPMLLGRIGDSAVAGAGFYAGEAGAIAVTGIGDHVLRCMLARWIYVRLEEGVPLKQAMEKGMERMPEGADLGLIGVSRHHTHVCANSSLPHHLIVRGE